jgi:hypothetical protein
MKKITLEEHFSIPEMSYRLKRQFASDYTKELDARLLDLEQWRLPEMDQYANADSFFLPLGYLGMSLLGMRRAPWLATISAALSLVGWIPWAALMGLDDLDYDIDRGASPRSLLRSGRTSTATPS